MKFERRATCSSDTREQQGRESEEHFGRGIGCDPRRPGRFFGRGHGGGTERFGVFQDRGGPEWFAPDAGGFGGPAAFAWGRPGFGRPDGSSEEPGGGFGWRGGPGRSGPGGPGGRGPGGRRRGMFDAAELRLMLLQLIADQPRHGYDLIRELETRTGGAWAPSPGVVYPTLTMLQDMGMIAEMPGEGARKVYAITPEGTAHLAEHRGEVDTLTGRIAELGTEQQRSEGTSARRALHNLHRALMLRFAANRGDAKDPELSHRVAALLDEVTQKIERS